LHKLICNRTKSSMHAQAIDLVSTERSMIETPITIRKCASIESTGAHCAILKLVNIYITTQRVGGCPHQSLPASPSIFKITFNHSQHSHLPSNFHQFRSLYLTFQVKQHQHQNNGSTSRPRSVHYPFHAHPDQTSRPIPSS